MISGVSYIGAAIEPIGVFTIIDAHVSTAGGANVQGPATGESFLITDLDITFYGGPNGNFFWSNKQNRFILNWRPGTENVQSFHWTGVQVLQPGEEWLFADQSAAGMDVEGACYLIPSILL